ncbi:hypothetical protein VTK26DRAFT_1740 [Humicola hyalothermophila]
MMINDDITRRSARVQHAELKIPTSLTWTFFGAPHYFHQARIRSPKLIERTRLHYPNRETSRKPASHRFLLVPAFPRTQRSIRRRQIAGSTNCNCIRLARLHVSGAWPPSTNQVEHLTFSLRFARAAKRSLRHLGCLHERNSTGCQCFKNHAWFNQVLTPPRE